MNVVNVLEPAVCTHHVCLAVKKLAFPDFETGLYIHNASLFRTGYEFARTLTIKTQPAVCRFQCSLLFGEQIKIKMCSGNVNYGINC